MARNKSRNIIGYCYATGRMGSRQIEAATYADVAVRGGGFLLRGKTKVAWEWNLNFARNRAKLPEGEFCARCVQNGDMPKTATIWRNKMETGSYLARIVAVWIAIILACSSASANDDEKRIRTTPFQLGFFGPAKLPYNINDVRGLSLGLLLANVNSLVGLQISFFGNMSADYYLSGKSTLVRT